jgi:hypothetical protein
MTGGRVGRTAQNYELRFENELVGGGSSETDGVFLCGNPLDWSIGLGLS